VTPETTPVVAPAPAVAAEVAPVKAYSAPAPVQPEVTAAPETDEQAELNILPPEQQKTAPAQTWESEGFRPAREPRNDRPRREEPRREERTERAPRQESAPFDPASIPAKFLYVRPGYNYVPTPSNYGGAPRERDSGPAASPSYTAPAAAAPQKSGGFLGWLKSLFGGSTPVPAAVEARPADQRNGDRHRGGRGRGPGGGGDGQRRRSRGGRNRSRGEYRSGGDQGGNSGDPSAT
jgi:translation initiation factor IF-2